MIQQAILYPLFALVLFTLYVSLRLAALRYRAVVRDGLKASYFKHNRGDKPPEYLLRITDHYDNLFEQPTLFYIVCILIYITSQTDLLLVILAWSYIATRLLHGYIHIKLNKILLRRNSFFLSMLVLFTLWGYLFVQLVMA